MDGVIYRDYNQESLDIEYNNRGRFPDTADCKAAQVVGSNEAKAEYECRLDVKFGEGETDLLDIYIAEGDGPRNSLLALGYAGWSPGQLDTEIQANGWLSVPADDELVFNSDPKSVWQDALAKMGIDVSMLSGDAGHA